MKRTPITTQHVVLAGLLAAFIVTTWYVLDVRPAHAPASESTPTAKTSTFESDELHLSFKYPGTYTLVKREIDVNGSLATYLTLTHTGETTPEAGEGPTGLTLAIFPNPKNLDLADWLHSMNSTAPTPTSCFDFAETRVDGNDALTYTSTGLYESDNVAVSHKGAIYIFSGSWRTREDQTVKDLGALITSVDLR